MLFCFAILIRTSVTGLCVFADCFDSSTMELKILVSSGKKEIVDTLFFFPWIGIWVVGALFVCARDIV